MIGLQEAYLLKNDPSVNELPGTLPDQSALFGLLFRLRNLGLPLVSVKFIENKKGKTK
jgi:hypothetical protein